MLLFAVIGCGVPAGGMRVRGSSSALWAGETPEQLVENVWVGYATTFLPRLLGLLVLVREPPRVLKIDLPSEAAARVLAVQMNRAEPSQ